VFALLGSPFSVRVQFGARTPNRTPNRTKNRTQKTNPELPAFARFGEVSPELEERRRKHEPENVRTQKNELESSSRLLL